MAERTGNLRGKHEELPEGTHDVTNEETDQGTELRECAGTLKGNSPRPYVERHGVV